MRPRSVDHLSNAGLYTLRIGGRPKERTMFCEIARKLDDDELDRIQSLEADLGMTLVAFACRSLDAAREEKLRKIMEEFGPQLQAPPAEPDDTQLDRIQALEADLGLALIAVEAPAS
jgi:hypothetical protein